MFEDRILSVSFTSDFQRRVWPELDVRARIERAASAEDQARQLTATEGDAA